MSGVALKRIAAGLTAAAGVYAAIAISVPYNGKDLPPSGKSADMIIFYDDHAFVREARIAAGVRALQTAGAGHLIMVGGWRPERNGYNGAALMAKRAAELGVPENAVLHDKGSNDTLSNLVGAARLMHTTEGEGVILVSDRYHLRRLHWLATRAGLVVVGMVSAEPAFTPWQRIERINHEILAWGSLILPRAWTEKLLAWSRRADINQKRMSLSYG